MRIQGTATLHAATDAVWTALNDPEVLVSTIPGCERLETVAADRYAMTITAGVASITGTYRGQIELADPEPPEALTLRASGSGTPGTVDAEVKVTLTDTGNGTTLLRYDADAVVGGPVGGVGQRVLSGVAKKTAGEFFTAVDAVLTGQVPVVPGAANGAAEEPVPGSPASRTPGAAPTDTSTPPGDIVAGDTGPGRVFTPAPGAAPGRAGGRDALVFVASGAAIALAGVWVGWRLGRRAG